MTTCPRRSYHHGIKQLVILPGKPDLFPELGIPRSTALSWIRRGMSNVVALDEDIEVEAALPARVSELEHRVAMLAAVLRLVLAIVRVSGFRLELSRLACAGSKRIILGAVERARKVMPLSSALRVLRLSSARYHAWKQASDACGLDDRPMYAQRVGRGLYLNHLDSLATVRKLVAFYVEQHNSVTPHAAFRGQTPDEMYFDTGGEVLDDLAARATRGPEASPRAQPGDRLRHLFEVQQRRGRMKPTPSSARIAAVCNCSADPPECCAS